MHWYLVSSFLFPLLKIAFFSKELMMLQQKVFCVNKLRTAQKKLCWFELFFSLRYFLRETAPIDLYRLEKHWSILILYFSEAGCENHKNYNEYFAFQSVLPTFLIVIRIIVGKLIKVKNLPIFIEIFKMMPQNFR